MSLLTWTPDELKSEFRAYERRIWRLVEAQHRVSTLKLVDGLAEQTVLENLIEDTKPLIPGECSHLDYLLSTPFRYGAYPNGSRFRRAGRTPGVFYAAEEPNTAAAEMVFYRLLFFAESPLTPWPSDAAEYTGFVAAVRSPRSLDLTAPQLVRDHALWTDRVDYGPCQKLAEIARAAETEIIRYRSVRDTEGGANVAVLKCAAFAFPTPLERQTWRIRLSAAGAQAICEFPLSRIEFDRDAFAADRRMEAMNWER
jgi:hypothetical protein